MRVVRIRRRIAAERIGASTLRGRVLLAAVVAACAPVTPERAAEDDAMWAAARECKARYVTIQSVERIEPDGRIHFTYFGSGPDNAAFLACYEEGLKRRLGSNAGLATGRVAAASRNIQRTVVPITKTGNSMYLDVRFNDQHTAVMLLDTGATSTILTPALANRLGIAAGPGARRRTFSVAGGATFSVPIVRLASLRVGDYVVEGLDVGVYNMLPHSPNVDGVLGIDFLQHFRISVDGDQRSLILELKSAAPSSGATPPAPSASAATYQVTLPLTADVVK